MTIKAHGRQYDVVVFGATGYTGQYTVESITAHLPSNLKWAVAGRSEAKLRTLIKDCKSINPDRLQPEIEICDLNPESLSQLASKTFILLTTVGPYSKYGEPAFKACAENGTHYVDVTGEISWTRKMAQKYEATARETGAILVPQNGIESTPPDVLTWALAKRLRTDLSAKVGDVTVSLYELNAEASGGTLTTAIDLAENNTIAELKAAHKPYAASPVANTTRRAKPSLMTRLTGLLTVPHLGLQTTCIAGSTDRAIVQRTWGLLSTTKSRQKEAYGPRFTFAEHYKARSVMHGILLHYAILTVGTLLFFAPPFRWLVKRFVFQPGQGPDREAAKKEHIEYRGVAKPDAAGGKVAFGRATYNGSMYMLSGQFLSQAALTLLEVDLDLEGGVYTPAMLGQPYLDRLDDVGFRIETKIIDE